MGTFVTAIDNENNVFGNSSSLTGGDKGRERFPPVTLTLTLSLQGRGN